LAYAQVAPNLSEENWLQTSFDSLRKEFSKVKPQTAIARNDEEPDESLLAGEVEKTCVGTGMGFDPAYYCYRPVHKYAAHGYGPVLLAGGEMIRLLKNTYPKMNDSAVQFYLKKQNTDKPIFSEE
jgi:hypothetical protein